MTFETTVLLFEIYFFSKSLLYKRAMNVVRRAGDEVYYYYFFFVLAPTVVVALPAGRGKEKRFKKKTEFAGRS
jgi:hypothetical protein